MVDDRYTPRPVAHWYMAAAIASEVFMLLGCALYLVDVTADPSSFTVDQRAVIEARPWWMTGAFGVAVWIGLAGTVLLVLRRKLAEPLLLISLIATVISFLPLVVVPAVSANATTSDFVAAVVVTAIVWTIFWFARHSRQRGWLR